MDPMAICNNLIDRLLAQVKSVLTAEMFEKLESGISNLAKIAAPVSAVVGALILFVLAIKIDSLLLFLGAFGWVFVVVLLYYIGSKLQHTCQLTLANNPSSIASQELLDVLIVTYGVLGAFSFIAGFYAAIKFSEFNFLVLGAVIFFLQVYAIWIVMHPHLVNTQVEPSTSAGMDAISFLNLGNKMFLRTYKLLFGLLPSVAAILLIKSLFKVFGNAAEFAFGGLQGAAGFLLLVIGLLAPLIAYLSFILTYLLLDVMRSILKLGLSASGATPSPAAGPASPVPAPSPSGESPGAPAAAPAPAASVSPEALKKLGIGLAVVLVILFGGVKGQELYKDYQEKAEMQRAEDARKKAEEEARLAQEAAEKAKREAESQRVASLVASARKYVGKSAQDLVLDPEINKHFREIFGDKMGDYENYFSSAGDVIEGGGLIVGQGCIKSACELNKALAVIDTASGNVYTAVIIAGNTVRYFGAREENVSSEVKKWVMANKR